MISTLSKPRGTAVPHSVADGAATTDFDLHGLVGIRLIGATRSDVAAVSRQLGLLAHPLTREPDITVRFVGRIRHCGPLRYLGACEAAFDDEHFFVLRGKHKSRTKAQIPFDQIGERCEILCESGLTAVPLLIPIINHAVLAKGAMPLHASAFRYDGRGIVTMGWSKGGKTEALLAFMANGAEYIGDEWIYIDADGWRIYGIPEPIRVWDWHLEHVPQYRAALSRKQRIRLRLGKHLVDSLDWAAQNRPARRFLPPSLNRRIAALVKGQQHVDMPPQTLFAESSAQQAATLDRVFFIASHESSEVTVEPVDGVRVADRMVHSLEEERASFLSYYRMYRFAFPARSNPLIDDAPPLYRRRLTRLLAGRQSMAVYHPYPVPIPALFAAMRPFL